MSESKVSSKTPEQYVAAASKLRSAMKGLGTNEDKIIETIIEFSSDELQVLIDIYRQEIQRDLIPDLKSEVGGNFLKVLLALMTPTDVYDSHMVRAAIQGLGTREKLLSKVICSRTPEELVGIARKYEGEYQTPMKKDIMDDVSGDYKQLLKVVLAREPDSTFKDLSDSKVEQDVDALYGAGEKKWGTDENVFINLIGGQPRNHVEKVAVAYGMKYGKHFTEVAKSEMSSTLSYALRVLTTPLPKFFAEEFNLAMKGLGTSDDLLIQTLTCVYSRCLRETTLEYLPMYKTNLKTAFANETSGDYKKLLVAIVDKYTAAS